LEKKTLRSTWTDFAARILIIKVAEGLKTATMELRLEALSYFDS